MVGLFALVIKFKEILLSTINQHDIIRKVKSATLLTPACCKKQK